LIFVSSGRHLRALLRARQDSRTREKFPDPDGTPPLLHRTKK